MPRNVDNGEKSRTQSRAFRIKTYKVSTQFMYAGAYILLTFPCMMSRMVSVTLGSSLGKDLLISMDAMMQVGVRIWCQGVV
jgi:hypothetical protein